MTFDPDYDPGETPPIPEPLVRSAFSRELDRIVQQMESLSIHPRSDAPSLADELRALHSQFANDQYDEETRSQMVYFLFENTERILSAIKRNDDLLTEAATRPVSIVTVCPKCGQLHVDEGEWRTKRHRTHLCAPGPHGPGCSFRWRPSNHPTVGVDWAAINEAGNGI